MKEILETIIMNLVAEQKSVSINEIVGENAHHRHQEISGQSAQEGSLFGFPFFINKSRRKHEEHAQDKIGYLADPSAVAHQKVQHIFHQADDDPADRPQGKGADQRRKLGKIQF